MAQNLKTCYQRLATKYQTEISAIPKYAGANFVRVPSSKTNSDICSETDKIESISVLSIQDDIAQNKSRKFLQSYIFNKPNIQRVSYPTEISGTTALLASPSGRKIAVLRQVDSENYGSNSQSKNGKGNGNGSEGKPSITAIEILNRDKFEFSVTSSHLHGKIYHSSELGGFAQSPDETEIAYVAEELPPKTTSFFKWDLDLSEKEKKTKAEEDKDQEKDTVKEGDQNLFRRDWGAGFLGVVNPRLFVLNLGTRKARKVDGIPKQVSVGHIEQAPDGQGIVFVGYSNEPRRYGIRAYNTRRSHLYYAQFKVPNNDDDTLNTSLKILSGETLDDQSQSYPRFNSAGTRLAQFSRSSKDKVHYSGSRLLTMKWDLSGVVDCDKKILLDTVEDPQTIEEFPGLYFYSLPNKIQGEDNRHIYLHSLHRSKSKILKIDTDNGNVNYISPHAMKEIRLKLQCDREEIIGEDPSMVLMDICSNYLLCCVSDPITPSSLWLLDINYAFQETSINHTCQTRITEYQALPKCINNLTYTTIQVEPKSSSKNGVSLGFEAVLVKPLAKSEDNKEKTQPLVLEMHGGPHGTYPSSFNYHNLTFLSALGLSILYVNYRGSLGFGQRSLTSVLGTGQDSNDCIDALDTVLSLYPYDSKRIGVIGASHGGYLTCMLIGKYPDRFAAAVAHNPVTNIAAMSAMTDIPDQCYVESGIDQDTKSFLSTPQNYDKMLKNSPLNYVDKVKTPLLMLLGKCDVRVPLLQNLEYISILKQCRPDNEVRTLVYQQGSHALSDTVEIDGDACLNRAMQLLKWLGCDKDVGDVAV